MGRIKRRDGPDRIFHITARVSWRAWHIEDDPAKRHLARRIAEAAEHFDTAILAYALLSNHLHAVVQSPPQEIYRGHTSRRTPCRHLRPHPPGHQNASVIAQFMRRLRKGTSDSRQRELGLTGRFWEGEYDARSITDPWGLAIRIAYDHRNPVRAGIVARPEDYPWSSASAWATRAAGVIPLTLQESLLGIDLETLRSDVIRFQKSKQVDDLKEFLHKRGIAWESRAGLALLRREVDRLGLAPPMCGTHAADA